MKRPQGSLAIDRMSEPALWNRLMLNTGRLAVTPRPWESYQEWRRMATESAAIARELYQRGQQLSLPGAVTLGVTEGTRAKGARRHYDVEE